MNMRNFKMELRQTKERFYTFALKMDFLVKLQGQDFRDMSFPIYILTPKK
ncbi:MAG: hypothetical protein ACOWWH_06530 [Eubacteriaceae bacterium]